MNSWPPGPASPMPGPPARGRAVGITLAAGAGRQAALIIAGVPLVLALVIGVTTTGNGGGPSPGYDGAPADGQTFSQVPGSASSVNYAPSSPGGAVGEGQTAASVPSVTEPAGGTATDGAQAIPTGTLSAAPSASGASDSPGPADPATTVEDAYAAINRGDYQTAYSLGLGQPGQSYADFAAGYQGTAQVTLNIISVSADTVTVSLIAQQTGGSEKTYQGTYTVSQGHITGSQISQVS